MNKISVMDDENKTIKIYNISYDCQSLLDYVNEISEIEQNKEADDITVSNIEETRLNTTEDLKKYLVSLIMQKVVNLSEINKLVKSNSSIRNVDTMLILKEFFNNINFDLEIAFSSTEVSNIARQFMIFDEGVSEEDIETLVVSSAINNREAFKNIGFSINNEKNKAR